MAVDRDFHALPPDLPVPLDDGAADHLLGMRLPQLALRSTLGGEVGLAEAAAQAGMLVLYVYPRTGTPGEPSPDGWDAIPGARGCTPQSCAFRDHARELAALGAQVLGLSAQRAAEQAAFAAREHLPFALLSDPGLRLAAALSLPTFEVAGMRLYKRITLVVEDGAIVKLFYPVYPPDQNAADVLVWLRERR
ncbi:MAG TPA: peroxiredoxin [Conexibacter sp.]|jgi:peroxiredoxin|nr:peroxiredoxin [Conexibacter sp.]